MAEIHKLIQPSPKLGEIADLVLCWSEIPERAHDATVDAGFSTSINNVTCRDCKKLWVNGNYGRKSNAEETQATT